MRRALLAVALLACAAAARAAPQAVRVASNTDWDLLVRRARSAPTYMEEVNGHRVYALVRDQAVEGQVCPGGRRARSQLFLAEPLGGATVRVYYLRVAALCVGAADAPDLQMFMLDAEADGVIADWSVWDPAADRIVNGISGSPTPAQQARLEMYRASLIALFLRL